MDHLEWMIDGEHSSERLDKFLSSVNDDMSRTRVQALVDEGKVWVNGDLVKSNYKLKAGDFVEMEVPEDISLDTKPEDIPLDIIYEDDMVLVVNKPKGMVVHPCPGNWEHTLVNALLFHCTDLSGINGVTRPGIVHRIDKDTSGLLAVAKNDVAHHFLSEQLQDKTMNRTYVALVHGVLPMDRGTIDAPIGRDPKDRQKMTVTEKNSKDAVTRFKVLERFKDKTLIECKLETGRTHQIRVHMQYIKYPIVGDPKYSYRNTDKTDGQMLHATELTFVHPATKEAMTFHAPLPEQFEVILQELRKEME